MIPDSLGPLPASTEVHVFVPATQQQQGPFAPDVVVEMARSGALPPDASVWHAGAPEWYPLARFLARQEPPAAPAPMANAAPLRPIRESSSQDGPTPAACVVRGIAAGFATALAGGGAWVAVSIAVGIRIPYVGLLVGWLVGLATAKASRDESSLLLPVSAVAFTLLAHAYFIPYFLVSPWFWLSLAFACFNAWKAAAN